MNLVHWNSLHPKKAIIPTFSGQTPNFLNEKQKNRTNNLHHQKAGSIVVILSLRVGVQHIQKSGILPLLPHLSSSTSLSLARRQHGRGGCLDSVLTLSRWQVRGPATTWSHPPGNS